MIDEAGGDKSETEAVGSSGENGTKAVEDETCMKGEVGGRHGLQAGWR